MEPGRPPNTPHPCTHTLQLWSFRRTNAPRLGSRWVLESPTLACDRVFALSLPLSLSAGSSCLQFFFCFSNWMPQHLIVTHSFKTEDQRQPPLSHSHTLPSSLNETSAEFFAPRAGSIDAGVASAPAPASSGSGWGGGGGNDIDDFSVPSQSAGSGSSSRGRAGGRGRGRGTGKPAVVSHSSPTIGCTCTCHPGRRG